MTTATPANIHPPDVTQTPAQQRAIDVYNSSQTHKDFQLMEIESYRETFTCLSVSRQAALHTLDYYVCMSLLLRGKGVDGVSHDDLMKEVTMKYEAASLLRMDLTEVADDYFDMKYMKSTVRDAMHFTDVSFRKEIRKIVCLALGTRLDDGTSVDMNVYTTTYKESE